MSLAGVPSRPQDILTIALAMSSSHFSSQRRKPQRFSTHRVIAVFAVLFFIAYYAAMLLLLQFPGFPDEPSSRSSTSALTLQSRANEQLPPIEERTPASRDTATPRGPSGEIAVAVKPPIALPPALSPAAGRPISVILTAPPQIAGGSTFEVSVGVPPGSGVHSAHFRLSYDDEALEILDATDATGTTVPVIPLGPGIADLDLDAERGARQAPAIRFLARTGVSRSVEIAVAVDLWDKAGNALTSRHTRSW
jgi:hypothetical protein